MDEMIGLEPDPVEEMEGALLRAVAVAFTARFQNGADAEDKLAEVQKLSRERLEYEPEIQVHAA